jgi:hypothetical protein
MLVRHRCALLGVAALPLAAFPTTAAAAAAAPIVAAVDKSAWSWRQALPAGLPVDEPSRVPEGDLAVASDGDPQGRPSKATYLHLDLSGLRAGSRVEALTVSLPLDPAGQSSDSAAVRLVACRLVAPFTPGEGVDPAVMPEEDCAGAPAGRYDAEAGSWSFGLTTLAAEWAADPLSNHGFVVRPPADYLLPTDLPFQLAFAGPSKVRVELLAELPAVAVPPVPETADRGQAAPPAFVPVEAPSFAAISPPVQPSVALPPDVAAPLTAPTQPALPAAAAAARATARALPPARTSTGALWSLAAFVGLLLVGVSRVAGNTAGPYALARLERERLDRLRLQVPAVVSAPLSALQPAQVPQRRHGRRPMSSATSTVT